MQLVKFIVFLLFLLSLLFLLFQLRLLRIAFTLLFSILPLFVRVGLRFANALLLLLLVIALLAVVLILTSSIFFTWIALQDGVSIFLLAQDKDKDLCLVGFLIGNRYNFNAEWGKSIPIKKASILLLAMGDRYHLAVRFKYPIALLHASKHDRQKILLTKKAIQCVLINEYIESSILEGQFLMDVMQLVCNFRIGVAFRSIPDYFLREIQTCDLVLQGGQFFTQVRTSASQFQNFSIFLYFSFQERNQLIWRGKPLKPLTDILLIPLLPKGCLVVVDSPSHNFKNNKGGNDEPFKYHRVCLKFIIKMEEENFAYIRCYKTDQPIEDIDEFPLNATERIQTDRFCTIVSSLFAVAMLVGAILSLNLSTLQRMTYPTDQQGRHCTLDNPNYNYLYFTSPTDPSKRLCVSECPTGQEQRLNCWPTEGLSCGKNNNAEFQVMIYSTEPVETSLGLFCKATDATLNNKLLENANLLEMYNFVKAYKEVGIAFLVAIGLGIVGVLAFSYLPGIMTYATIIVGGVGSVIFAIYLLAADSSIATVYRELVIVFAVLLAFVGVLLLYASIWRQKDVKISILYLSQSSKCFWEFPALAGLSFLFVIFLLGLTALIGFQTLAYWSNSEQKFDSKSVYTSPVNGFAIFMTVLNFIQFVWGLSFLKEAFNMLVSGTAVSWYFRKKHSLPFAMGNLFKFHWGSVVAAAFLLHLMYPLDLVYDAFKPAPNSRGAYRSFCCCCEKAMVLVNIAGLPYCNASRWCQKVHYHSESTDSNQSANRYVRIGAHVTLALLATLVAYLAMHAGSISVLALVLSFIVNLFAVTFFICLLKDIVQALYFSFELQEYYANTGNDSVAKKLFPEGYEVLPTQN